MRRSTIVLLIPSFRLREYRQLVESGKLEDLKMPEPQQSTNRMWRRFGSTTLGIGISLIALVLYAMIFAYR
jgi:hypothetical protein